jgi:hypothetical protein
VAVNRSPRNDIRWVAIWRSLTEAECQILRVPQNKLINSVNTKEKIQFIRAYCGMMDELEQRRKSNQLDTGIDPAQKL